MKLGRVIGRVWASRKAREMKGCPLYILQPVASDGRDAGTQLVAADPGGLGAPGVTVVYVTSTDATQAFPTGYAPVNASIVELVDEVS